MLITDYLSTSSGGQISLSSPSMPFSQLGSPWVTPHCIYPVKLLIYSNIAHPTSLETLEAVAHMTWIWAATSLCWCQDIPLTDVFCYISVIVLVGLHPIGWTIQKESFLFLESASGNFRASVKVLLWWYLIERDINTYRSFCWLWAMWTYSNAQCPCFNLCSDVCVHFSLTSLHFQSSILTCAAGKI